MTTNIAWGPLGSIKYSEGDLVSDDFSNIIYKGKDNRMQIIYGVLEGSYGHAWVDTYWSTNNYLVNSREGSIIFGRSGEFLYTGIDNKLHRFYWTGHPVNPFEHELIPYSYNSYSLIDSNLEWLPKSSKVSYKGVDDRIQSFYLDQNSNQYIHFWMDDYWNTDEFLGADFPSIAGSTQSDVFYRNTKGELCSFKYRACEVLNPPCDEDINLRQDDILEYYSNEGKMVIVYPNPAFDFFSIQVNNQIKHNELISYNLVDVSGRVVMSGSGRLNEGLLKVTCASVNRGVYSLCLVIGKNNYVQRIVVH